MPTWVTISMRTCASRQREIDTTCRRMIAVSFATKKEPTIWLRKCHQSMYQTTFQDVDVVTVFLISG